MSTDRLALRLLPAVARAPALKLVVAWSHWPRPRSNVPVLTWAEALALGEQSAAPRLDPATTLTRDDLACFIYTSGRAAIPRASCSHGNILANVAGAHGVLETLDLGAGRCSCRSCRCPMPTNTRRGSSCRWRWGADLLRRRSGSAGQQLRRSAPDHRRLRAPAVRGDAPAHPEDDRAPPGLKAKLFAKTSPWAARPTNAPRR